MGISSGTIELLHCWKTVLFLEFFTFKMYFLHTYTWGASVEEVCKYPLWQADSECLQCSGRAPLLSWPQLGSCMKKTDTTSHCVCEPDGNKRLRISASLTLKHLFISIVVHFIAVVWKHRLSHFRCAWFNLTQGAGGRSDESCSSLNKVFKGQGGTGWWLTKKKLCNSLEEMRIAVLPVQHGSTNIKKVLWSESL